MTDQNRYSRDSFDRFGSDLCELILSYLPLKEKFKYESVCGHWRSLVFTGQNTLHICYTDGYHSLKSLTFSQSEDKYYNKYSINNIYFEHLLKKCPNIRTIKIDWKCNCDDKTLELIAEYCPALTRFIISSTELLQNPLSERVLHVFGQKCGRSLTAIQTDDKFNGNFKLLLNYCKNLRSIQALNDCQILVESNSDFLPKLRELSYMLTEDKDLIGFKLLSEKYCKQLKNLSLSIRVGETETENSIIRSDLNEVLITVSRFRKLEFLKINLKGYYGQSFAAGVREIGHKCLDLIYFDLETYDSLILENVFGLFRGFTRLEYLSLNCRYPHKFESMQNLMSSLSQSNDYGSVESLAKCRHLTHLKLNLLQLTDENLESIDSILPNLKLLELKSSKRLTDKTVESIANLEKLKSFRMFFKHINNQTICDLITKRPFLHDMYFDGFPTIQTDCLIILWNNALNNPKIKYNLYYSGPRVDLDISQFPDNLKVLNSWDKQWY